MPGRGGLLLPCHGHLSGDDLACAHTALCDARLHLCRRCGACHADLSPGHSAARLHPRAHLSACRGRAGCQLSGVAARQHVITGGLEPLAEQPAKIESGLLAVPATHAAQVQELLRGLVGDVGSVGLPGMGGSFFGLASICTSFGSGQASLFKANLSASVKPCAARAAVATDSRPLCIGDAKKAWTGTACYRKQRLSPGDDASGSSSFSQVHQ